ncbi:MAG TPA: aminotransferase class I/II-fold pyridoxal phosphate-dependent enzyme [Ignavibacteria bacterium]|nr:aminotransferase class I/II-fold pyridoxal phosphate-dependent enzyme [Ignavibacteria bacterium]
MKTKPKIWLSSPHMGKMEQQFVKEAFDTNWIAPVGPHINAFEEDICQYTGIKYAVALSSGTAALHIALILLGIGKGDIVLCQSMTFSASANPIVYQGATPVFIDSEEDTWNMSPLFLEEAIKSRLKKGKKPVAIIVVDLYGMPAKLEEISGIALKYNIPLIEDAAEALGSHINSKMCGRFGKLSVLSFNGNKIITTSGGGALLSEDEEIINKSRFLASQARDTAPHFQHSSIGYNYRISNVLAGIGRGQMIVLPERIRQRRKNFERYSTYFKEIAKRGYIINFQPEPKGFYSNRWLTVITIDPAVNNRITREDLRLAFMQENIESRPLWKPMHLQPVFNNAPFYGNGISEKLFEIGLCLPSGSNLTASDFDRILGVMNNLFC